MGGRRPRSRRGASGTGGSGPALRPPGRPRAPLPRRRGGRWGAPAGRGRGAPPRPAVRPGSQPRGASACRPSPSPGPPSAHWIRRGPCPWFSGSRRGARGGVGAGRAEAPFSSHSQAEAAARLRGAGRGGGRRGSLPAAPARVQLSPEAPLRSAAVGGGAPHASRRGQAPCAALRPAAEGVKDIEARGPSAAVAPRGGGGSRGPGWEETRGAASPASSTLRALPGARTGFVILKKPLLPAPPQAISQVALSQT